MSDYKDIIRNPETLYWFKAAMGVKISRDCLLEIVKEISRECYDNIRREIKQYHGVLESDVCNQCHTPNVLPCDPTNICCKRYRGKCAFHEIYKQRNCPNNLCDEICKQIVKQHRFRSQQNPHSFKGPTWINTDASKWCSEPWQISKCFISKDGYKDANQAESTDFNGIVNVMYNCEYFQTYFKDDLTQQENVCTKARDVGRAVRHTCAMAMIRQDSDRAIDTLVSLLQNLNHVDHQATSLMAVDKLTQLKNGTLAITDEDIALTFEHFKDNLTGEIKEVLEKEKETLVRAMDDALKNIGENITEAIIDAGDDQLAKIKSKGDEVLNELDNVASAVKLLIPSTTPKTNELKHPGVTVDENTPPTVEMSSTLSKIQAWLIEQYQAMCVAPVSMLDTDIDVPLERIYVTPSIKELKRVQKDQNAVHHTVQSTPSSNDVSRYNELLLRDRKPVNTIYIQGNPGCGKTTFSNKLVLDWCIAQSTKVTSKKDTSSATTSKKTPKQKAFDDLDTLRDFTFLFFVSLRDYSGYMCNVTQMIEDAIKRKQLTWDDRVWEHKCLVLTDAADEWFHAEIPFPPPSDSTCKCHKDRTMPLYLQRNNITNIITARPWKLADLKLSDTLTRTFEISGVLDYTTLSKKLFRVLAKKDSISKKDQQAKSTEFFNQINTHNLKHIITIPAMCVQLVHQFYVGRLTEGSWCAVYVNMLDMHIARGLQKLQIPKFDTGNKSCGDIPDILITETAEYMKANLSLVYSASELACKTLTDTNKHSSLVFRENTITQYMTKTEQDYLIQTGIITKKKSFALCPGMNVPYMFVHKTIQEFLSSLYIAMTRTEMDAIMHAIQLAYCDGKSILDIGQLFIFTCGICLPAAERMSKHITDVITNDMECKLQDGSEVFFPFSLRSEAQNIVLDGIIEGAANEQARFRLNFSHIIYEPELSNRYWVFGPYSSRIKAVKTLKDMNMSNIVSIDTAYTGSLDEYPLQEIIKQSRETLSYLGIHNDGNIDLQGVKLKYLECGIKINITSVDCSNMVSCTLTKVTQLTERVLFESLSATGENIRFLNIDRCANIKLFCEALKNLKCLHTLKLTDTQLDDTQLHDYSPVSIRLVRYCRTRVSVQVIKSMVEWSKSRDVCVKCELAWSTDDLSEDAKYVCDWIKQQDGIAFYDYSDTIIPIRACTNICWSKRLNLEVNN
ncbi:uncharacterized protein LOC127858418 isoform X2 [Dreissena polymorpha]|uniref:uncharacterized protein LOC127858418 isoform X2 n=1 Tax=Dreissena polymorpha TaxID=45954 RepID=UPI002264FAAE|nr:uncharacterized protein LOC127858418 isoform X2 [Dreissena polymorpha]XP_052251520.1 uncharacterized protein LOC127858418 isoform X2 [Dreissena polymorpha]